mgnify:CR=1 FL=1
MTQKRFDDADCAVARALSEVGDWWSLRVVLEAMHGTRRFVDFQRNLGIARNILCNRLNRLVEYQILRKVDVGEHGRHYEYRLTDKGRDLFTVVVALRQWGDKWIPTAAGKSSEIRDRNSGRPIGTVQVCDADGRPIGIREVVLGDAEI